MNSASWIHLQKRILRTIKYGIIGEPLLRNLAMPIESSTSATACSKQTRKTTMLGLTGHFVVTCGRSRLRFTKFYMLVHRYFAVIVTFYHTPARIASITCHNCILCSGNGYYALSIYGKESWRILNGYYWLISGTTPLGIR